MGGRLHTTLEDSLDSISPVRAAVLSADSAEGLSYQDFDATLETEVVELAKVFRCDPVDLVAAAGRQLRRSDRVETPFYEHSDVLALEAIASVLRLSGESLTSIPAISSDVELARHLEHVRECDVCIQGVTKLSATLPIAEWADVPPLNPDLF